MNQCGMKRTRHQPHPLVLALQIAGLVGGVAYSAVSGTVRLAGGGGLSGVEVSLSSKALASTATDAEGKWVLGGVSRLPEKAPEKRVSSNLQLVQGRLLLDLGETRADGRRPSDGRMPDRVTSHLARMAAATDTLLFKIRGGLRARLPIGTLDTTGIMTVLDTTWGSPATCPTTVPTGPAYYASPTGTGSSCSLQSPCALATAVKKPKPGESVYLRGGSYTSPYFTIAVSGSKDSGWITVAAYPCELPIIEGNGVGVSGSFVRVDGLVSRNAASGFGNKWTGAGTTNSNGNVEFRNCIADGNSRNGIAFNSAAGVRIKQCIVAHNGHSPTASWSSGVNIYGAQGTWKDNVVESNVAFENVDMQHHSDGSGFIVDDIGTGTSFINNIGFRNGGSCIRLTTSTNTHIVNNTCYHDGLDSLAGSDPQYTQPKSPGEILFSSAETRTGVVMVNNLAAASGWNGTQTSFPGAGTVPVTPWNLGVDKNGPTPFFVSPDGDHPDFHLAPQATGAIGKGTATQAPATDIGFDPRCITKAPPNLAAARGWWMYSVDYDYIRTIGGVAQCFHPKARTGAIDLGAYAQ